MQSWVVAPNWEGLRAAAPDAHLQPPQYNHKFHPCEQHKQPQKSCNMSFASVKITLIFSFLKMSLKIKNRILAWNFLCFKSYISRDFVLEGFQESIIFQRIFFLVFCGKYPKYFLWLTVSHVCKRVKGWKYVLLA